MEHLSFRLNDEFIEGYESRPVQWGFPCGGHNALGELTFLTKYSRLRADGTKERWHDTCRRVVEGTYSILKEHCTSQRTPWNHAKAMRAAEDMYERLYTMKWTPPGRGLWMMGSKFVAEEGSAALQNCAWVSTEKLGIANPTQPFVRLMEMLMLGVGVGFDTRGVGKLRVYDGPISTNGGDPSWHTIEDSREGWVKSQELLLRSYLTPNHGSVGFDYSKVRPAGSPIKRFGGVAAGPEPLKRLHDQTRQLLQAYVGRHIDSAFIVDVMNLEGKCIIAGNVRRSAEIALGMPDDKAFIQLKNPALNPDRMGPDGWGFLSNNSVIAEVGGDYSHLAEHIEVNGEPGLVYLDLAREYGRLGDPPNGRDHRASGVNPCAEQTLEDQECCTLVETYPTRCTDVEDFRRTLKVAYLYAKTVTLLPTHWPESNEVMQRNRRIGCSVSGVAQFAEAHGWTEMSSWLQTGYAEVTSRDRQYSEWLGVRESIKMTSVKPSGTVSILTGVTPGVHWPVASDEYIRRQRFRVNDPLVQAFERARYHVEPDVMDPTNTVVISFPTLGPTVRAERDVSVWEKVALAARLQRDWADNNVSATFTFQEHERDQIGAILRAFDGQLKTMSFLPLLESGGAYAQMPYESISHEDFEAQFDAARRINLKTLYSGDDAEGEKYCNNDRCDVP